MKDFKLYFGIASALLLIYLIAQFNKPNPVNWSTTLTYSDKIPYGTYIFYKQLKDIFPAAEVKRTNKSAYQIFNDSTLLPANYLITANDVELSKTDLTAMIKYISAGNSVFISSFSFDGYFADSLKLRVSEENNDENSALSFTNPRLKRATGYKFENHISSQYFSRFDTTKATVISQNTKGKAAYLSFTFGKGKLYLFANPQILTNYSLLKPPGAEYTAKALSYLPATKNIYWDQYQNHDIADDQSPMRVFFAHPGLQWAYYLSLASLLIFILYEIKRRQRIIPVIEPLKNATVEFVSVVGKVYYEQRDNGNIAAKKIVYFAEYVRTKFGIKTNAYNGEFTTTLINKTGVDQSLAKDLVNHIIYLGHQHGVTDHELIVLNQLIEKFYIQTGSYGK